MRHGCKEQEDVGGAGTRDRGHRVELFLGLHPQELAGGADHLLDQQLFIGGDGRAREQAGDALAHQCGRVGHGTHDAIGSQPRRDAVAGDAGGNAQVHGAVREGACCGRCLFEGLGLDGPDHESRLTKRIGGCGQCLDAEVLAQIGASFLPRLHHQNLRRGNALRDQAADDGAGHVAAADEGDGGEGVRGGCGGRGHGGTTQTDRSMERENAAALQGDYTRAGQTLRGIQTSFHMAARLLRKSDELRDLGRVEVVVAHQQQHAFAGRQR
ncbi:hypothetical protein SDC9_116274 [bioreactor metagenome]|uniref:Uncharacterized protein n=1 Tax=bioreactor metagenome TaxID=1076179 RepID=A0A645BV77_9ZZZZ